MLDSKLQSLIDENITLLIQYLVYRDPLTAEKVIVELGKIYRKMHARFPSYSIFNDMPLNKLKVAVRNFLIGEGDITAVPNIYQLHELLPKMREIIEEDKLKTWMNNAPKDQKEFIINKITHCFVENDFLNAIQIIFLKYQHPFGPGVSLEKIQQAIKHSFKTDDFNDKILSLYGLDIQIQVSKELKLNEFFDQYRPDAIDYGLRTELALSAYHGDSVVYQGTPRKIITGDIDFSGCNEILLNAGGSQREIIVVDPNSHILLDCYSVLKSHLKGRIAEGVSQREILDIFLLYVKNLLPNDFCLDNDLEKLQHTVEHDNAFVPLDEFIRHKKGVCRHSASIAAVLAGKLMTDKIIAPGDVHLYRNDTNNRNAAHQVVVIRDRLDSCLWIIDALNAVKSLKVPMSGEMVGEDLQIYEQLKKILGDKFIPAAQERFTPRKGW